ncbi:MAG TPA: hypothetical protein PK299_05130 [Anaerolineales bacterium]|nr:hypothetical protein [Anaerolineales bacterium]
MKQKHSTPLHNWIQIVLFFCIICIPAILMFALPPKATSERERRNLAKPPYYGTDGFSSFKRRVQEYLQDHFGLRDEMILANSYVDYAVFSRAERRSSGIDLKGQVVIGKDGWFFSNVDHAMENYRGAITITPEEMQRLVQRFVERKAYFESQGIAYYLIIPPDKELIYPEYIPERYQVLQENHTLFDQLAVELQRNGILLWDMRPALIDAKATSTVYMKTDTHWSDWGGYVGYQQMIAALNRQFPEIETVPHERFTQSIIHISEGDMAVLLGLFGIIREDKEIWKLDQPCAQQQPYPWGGDDKSFYYRCETGKHKVVIFADSFIVAPRQGLTESFQETVILRKWYDPTIAEQLVKDFQPTIVIDQIVGRKLWYLLERE